MVFSRRPGAWVERHPRPPVSAHDANLSAAGVRASRSLRCLQGRRSVYSDVRRQPRREAPEPPSKRHVLSQSQIHREESPAHDTRTNHRAYRIVPDLLQRSQIELGATPYAADGDLGERVPGVDRYCLLMNDGAGVDTAIDV